MHTEDSIIDECTDWETVEKVAEESPGSVVSVFSGDFLIESVGHGDISGLVITSKKCNLLRVFHFQAKEVFHCFNGVVTSVDEVADEDVFVVWELTTDLEKFQEVKKLSVDISADIYGRAHWLDIGLFQQDFTGSVYHLLEFSFIQEIFVFVIGISQVIE